MVENLCLRLRGSISLILIVRLGIQDDFLSSVLIMFQKELEFEKDERL